MREFTSPFLLALLVLILAPATSSAQSDNEPRGDSIIRVIKISDEFGEVESEIETRVVGGDLTATTPTWFGKLPLKRGYLGIQLLELTPELRTHFGVPGDSGVMVSRVVEDSPAEAAGVAVGDIIATIDGDPVGGSFEVSRKIAGYEDGRSVPLEIWRDRKVEVVTATIAERERAAIDVGRLMLESRSLGDPTAVSRIFVGGLDDTVSVDGHGRIHEQIIEIDEVHLQDALRDFKLRIDDPAFLNKVRMLGHDREDLQARIQELEKRLKELEKQLEKLPGN